MTTTPTAYFASAVKHYRTHRRWTQPELARRCQRAGLDWDRSIVANVEAGRRAAVSIHEVLVLAHVLGVPVPMLLFPLESGEPVEIVPGVVVHPLHAYGFLKGNGALPGSEIPPIEFGRVAHPLHLLREYETRHEDAARARDHLRAARRNKESDALIAQFTETYLAELRSLVAYHQQLSAAGVTFGMDARFYDDAIEMGIKIPPLVTRHEEERDSGR